MPAAAAALSADTERTSRPSRWGSPTERRRRRATRGGAIATPRRTGRTLSPLHSRSARSARRSPVGIATIRPPSRRTAFNPSRRPSRSTSGPPPEPRGSGAVCSMPTIARPRGPRISRPSAATNPGVARRPRPPGSPNAITAVPMCGAGVDGSHSTGSMSAVSTATAAMSRSGSMPTTRPDSRRPPWKLTVTSSPRRLCAAVRTRPGATTTPLPRPHPRPKPTTAGPTRSTAWPMAC